MRKTFPQFDYTENLWVFASDDQFFFLFRECWHDDVWNWGNEFFAAKTCSDSSSSLFIASRVSQQNIPRRTFALPEISICLSDFPRSKINLKGRFSNILLLVRENRSSEWQVASESESQENKGEHSRFHHVNMSETLNIICSWNQKSKLFSTYLHFHLWYNVKMWAIMHSMN